MIEAHFDPQSRRAAADGVYQYDTGQRLIMRGLPVPDEINGTDIAPPGDEAAVQVQYGRIGDSQSEMRLGQWDADEQAWTAEIPDEYLTRSDAVHVYVSVNHGASTARTESGVRSRTLYEGVFTPIQRPAPHDTVSPEQMESWNKIRAEVELNLTSANASIQKAEQARQEADKAAGEAREGADKAEGAAKGADRERARLDATGARFGGLTVRAVALDSGASATATLRGDVLELGVPRGKPGARGATGAQGETGPAEFAWSESGGVLTITPR